MITKALIENFRETVKPVVSQLLFGVNYEGMGTLDCEEFERDFDEILDLALAGYEQKVNNAVSTLDGNKNDMVYRQQAIDAIANCTNCGDEKTLRAYVAKHNLDNGWTGGVLDAIDAIEDLPSVQPEP